MTDVGFNSTDAAINTTQTSHTFTNLEEYNVYSCVIAAATRVGLGPYSELIWFTTQEDGKLFSESIYDGNFLDGALVHNRATVCGQLY